MKKSEKLNNDVSVKETKLKISDIKKNSSVEVSHTIKKIKQEEFKFVAITSSIIFLLLCLVAYIGFTSFGVDDLKGYECGPLYIEFLDDGTGMSDIVNFTGGVSAEAFKTEVTISNTSSSNSWYELNIEDYMEMITFDDCSDKLLDKNKIFFSVDGGETNTLASIYDDGKYVLMHGIVASNDIIKHEITLWYEDIEEKHFHGKVNVEYLR